MNDDPHWLSIQVENFDDGGSILRSFLHKSLALIAPRMVFDSELIARLDYGMKIPYFMMDTPLVLYAVSRGDPEQKLANLKKWKSAYFMNPAEELTVDRFLKGDPAANPLQYWLLRNTSYALLRLECQLSGPAVNAALPPGIALSDVWERVQKHPLVSPCIELQRPTERKSNG